MRDDELPRGIASDPVGPVVVHFDGACEPPRGGGVAAFGFTVDGPELPHEGHGLAVPPLHPHATNNVAEYVGAIRALEWLLAHGYRGPVAVLGDSQLVIRQMNGEYRVRAEHLRPYHESLARLARQFVSVEFRWVPREENEAADRLSKLGIEEAATGRRREPSGADALRGGR
jgi:ribonuclease HI